MLYGLYGLCMGGPAYVYKYVTWSFPLIQGFHFAHSNKRSMNPLFQNIEQYHRLLLTFKFIILFVMQLQGEVEWLDTVASIGYY
jgi:hypothetical protein